MNHSENIRNAQIHTTAPIQYYQIKYLFANNFFFPCWSSVKNTFAWPSINGCSLQLDIFENEKQIEITLSVTTFDIGRFAIRKIR